MLPVGSKEQGALCFWASPTGRWQSIQGWGRQLPGSHLLSSRLRLPGGTREGQGQGFHPHPPQHPQESSDP